VDDTLFSADPAFLDDALRFDAWPAAGEAQWRALVERELRGAALEHGFHQPLYGEADRPDAGVLGFPGTFPFTRGRLPDGTAPFSRCWLGTELAGPPAAARAALEADLELGAELIELRLQGDDALAWNTLADLDALLEGVEPRYLHFLLDAGPHGLTAAELWLRWARDRGHAPGELLGFLNFDPLAQLALQGRLPGSLDASWRQAAGLARFCRDQAPGLRALTVSTAPWSAAGANPAQILACGLATFVETLRRLDEQGFEPAATAAQVLFRHEAGSEIFLEIAKLRAFRLLVTKALAALGAPEAAAGQVHILRTAEVEITRVDPWVNLLRATAQAFVATVAGADGLIVLPYDRALGRSDELARRLALTTQHVLADESHLLRVADPAGGSYALEAMTERLAREAWALFQEIEREGGMAACLVAGRPQAWARTAADQRRGELAKRKRQLVGVSAFPNLGERRPVREAPVAEPAPPGAGDAESADFVAAVSGGAVASGSGTPAVAPPLAIFRPAAGFEALRLAADAAPERPRIFLANLGAPADHRARTEFCAGFFPAGGVETVDLGSFDDMDCLRTAFRTSGCRAAILCGSDDAYARFGTAAADALLSAGARQLSVAGRGGALETELHLAGVETFVYLGCDAVATLDRLLRRLGVPR
jgi:methylmalonyl-CoA mutase